jgi:histidine triad (HIT) family protein
VTAHTHRTHVEGCYRCELSRDEMTTADALTEVADYHVTECVDMHGDQGEDGPGPDCCFHARAAYTVGDAARLLRTPDTPTDPDTSNELFTEARRLLDAATPGPWTHPSPTANWFTTPQPIQIDEADWGQETQEGGAMCGYRIGTLADERAWRYADVELIAAAPRLIAALLERAVTAEAATTLTGAAGYIRKLTAERDAERAARERAEAEARQLREQLDAAQLRSIEARNPGIDMDEVRAFRAGAAVAEGAEDRGQTEGRPMAEPISDRIRSERRREASERADCPFCAIIAGTAPATIVREWRDAICIVPLNPVVEGHVLVIPKDHVQTFFSSPDVSVIAMRRAAELVHGVERWVNPHDYNIITSAGRAATQTVMHLHVHLVPRVEGDGLLLPWSDQRAEDRGQTHTQNKENER